MNDIAAVAGHPAPATADCFHCGDPLPATPVALRLDGALRDFCCSGCAAAAQWIGDADLGDYYRLREVPGRRIDADDAALALGRQLRQDGGLEVAVYGVPM